MWTKLKQKHSLLFWIFEKVMSMSAPKFVALGFVFFVAAAGAWLTLLEYTVDANGIHGWHLKK